MRVFYIRITTSFEYICLLNGWYCLAKRTIKIILMLITILGYSSAEANRHQVSKNEVSNFFNEEIEDRQALDKFLEDSKKQSQSAAESMEAMKILELNEQSIKEETSKLNAIHVNSLESSGQEERIKEENSYYNQLEVNYDDPKIINHKRDIDKIAAVNDKLTSRLIEGLRELNIDCKTVKGRKELEPEYRLEIEKEHLKDTIYNQHICEELRNKYNCQDSLSMRCTKRSMHWGAWEYKQIDIPGYVVYHQAKHLGYAVHWKRKRWGWHLNFGKQAEWRMYLSGYLGVPLEQISEQISFPGNWGGSIGKPPVDIGEEYRHVYPYYRFGYYYRNGHEICEQWKEDWSETCVLQ